MINTQKYEPLVINMVKSGNDHFENKMFILSVKYGTIPFCRVATLSLNIAVTLHITVFVRKKHSSKRARQDQTVAYTLTQLVLNAREVTQFP